MLFFANLYNARNQVHYMASQSKSFLVKEEAVDFLTDQFNGTTKKTWRHMIDVYLTNQVHYML